MAIRNESQMGGIGGGGMGGRQPKPIPVHVPIPPVFDSVHKIEVDNGTDIIDVTELVINASFTMATTDSVGQFDLEIDNSAEMYNNLFKSWNIVRFYIDYGTDANTVRFTGFVERSGYSNYSIKLSGRSTAIKFTGKSITYSAVNKSKSEILKEIIENSFDDLSTDGIEENMELATVNYSEVYLSDVIIDLCGNNFDGYIDENFVMQYFQKGSRDNELESVVHDYNLIETSDFSEDIENMYNKVRIYGVSYGDTPLMYTSYNEESMYNYSERFTKEEYSNIKLPEEAKRIAQNKLLRLQNPSQIGVVKSLMLPSIKVGENLKISDPQNGLEPDKYFVYKVVHTISNDEPPLTEITIDKDILSISELLSDRIKFEIDSSNRLNPANYDYSHIISFEKKEGTFSNTSIVSVGTGDEAKYYLVVVDNSTGIWTSPSIKLNKIPERITFRLNGELLDGSYQEGVILQYSFDGGNHYYTWGMGQASVPVISSIMVRVHLSNPASRLQYIGIMYS